MFLVTGATGSLGRRIVRLLRDRDLPVRAFVRLMSKYHELEERGAEIFVGDLNNDQDINRAITGVRYIISTHGAGGNSQALAYRANRELILQGQGKDVEHFVFISVLGADRGYEDAPIFKAKREIEKMLYAGDLNYTVFRPAGFADNLLSAAERFRDTGIYLSVGHLDNRTSLVSTDDLAQIAVDSIGRDRAYRQIFDVGGPDILKRADIPRIFARLFNQEPIIINPPLWLFDGIREGIGFFNPQTQQELGTFRTLLANEFYCNAATIERLESAYDIKMESFESFIRRYLGAES
ncbi:MAG: SDR family oxidoreductase [Jaaginema sp. PMC 1079.18]|nr:SDR family oxidoreductase [Jaaginema sp. PMC 1080.18]MEC4852520.1 SDR family oxidoreductase [Jaaginema sp. PMC 1079.18]MEC4865850.1 SDR family oxidoreductase [Jaaginema sp. PMC 1078.18]